MYNNFMEGFLIIVYFIIKQFVLTDPEIVNGLNWSSIVDDTFRRNAEDDPTLGWQYFAAQTGFMRLYPSVTK